MQNIVNDLVVPGGPLRMADARLWALLTADEWPLDTPWAEVEALQALYSQKLQHLCSVLTHWIDEHGGDPEYCQVIDDPYDGLHLPVDDIVRLGQHILVLGSESYQTWLHTPFLNNITSYFYRNVSCGNSSCLYLDRMLFVQDTWDDKLVAFVQGRLNEQRKRIVLSLDNEG